MTPLMELKSRIEARRDKYLQRSRECLKNGRQRYASENWTAYGFMNEVLKVVADVDNGRPDTQN